MVFKIQMHLPSSIFGKVDPGLIDYAPLRSPSPRQLAQDVAEQDSQHLHSALQRAGVTESAIALTVIV